MLVVRTVDRVIHVGQDAAYPRSKHFQVPKKGQCFFGHEVCAARGLGQRLIEESMSNGFVRDSLVLEPFDSSIDRAIRKRPP